jgi:hypothetical protein
MNFVDISGASGLNFSQLLEYKDAWNTFNRIQNYNSNASTLINAGASDQHYYNFSNYTEKNMFNRGQLLHIKAYPYYSTLWYSVEKNYR